MERARSKKQGAAGRQERERQCETKTKTQTEARPYHFGSCISQATRLHFFHHYFALRLGHVHLVPLTFDLRGEIAQRRLALRPVCMDGAEARWISNTLVQTGSSSTATQRQANKTHRRSAHATIRVARTILQFICAVLQCAQGIRVDTNLVMLPQKRIRCQSPGSNPEMIQPIASLRARKAMLWELT